MFDSTPFMQNSTAFEWLVNQSHHSRAYYEARYQKVLEGTPAPGCGLDCHTYLPKIARFGVLAGHTPDEIHADIKATIPSGKRRVSDREIRDAINFVLRTSAPAGCGSVERPFVEIDCRRKLSEAEAAKVRKHVLSYSTGPGNLDSEDFRRIHGFQFEPQPMTALYPEAFTMIHLIRELYDPGDLLYIGPERMGFGLDNIRTAAEWLSFFEEQQRAILERVGNTDWNSSTPSAFLLNLGMRYSHIVPNPVTGRFGKTKDKKDSLRCDDSIRDFRYAVIDFDGHDPLEEQGRVLHCLCEAMDIRICALIQTGGRDGCGLHAWVRIDGVDSLETWNSMVRDDLFVTFEALGADPACANPSRGSRNPGLPRWGTSLWQKLLFVSKEGVKI